MHDLKTELRDQAAHMAAATLVLAPLFAHPCVLTALLAGLGVGFVREISQSAEKFSWAAVKEVLGGPNHRFDMAFWGLGALVAYLLFA